VHLPAEGTKIRRPVDRMEDNDLNEWLRKWLQTVACSFWCAREGPL
jgi:hypothetical protein